MSKLPQLNLRIPEQHHPLVRRLAECLRERTGDAFAAELMAFLEDRPAPAPLGDLAALAERVAALEAMLAPAPAPAPEPDIQPAKNEYIADEIRSKASALKAKGMTWEAVWLELGRPGTVNGLRNAVGKWRKRYHVKDED
jgi:hypothetical protein